MTILREFREWNVAVAFCRCGCGLTTHALADEVRAGVVQSCGHGRAAMNVDKLLDRTMPVGWLINYRALMGGVDA